MITQTEFEKLAKRIMDRQLRPWLKSKGMEFSRENQEIFVEHLQPFIFGELNAMGLWQKMMGIQDTQISNSSLKRTGDL